MNEQPVTQEQQQKHSFAPDGATERKKAFWADFREFLKQYSVIGLAIGVVMGTAVNNLVQAFVQGIVTPFIGLLIPNEKFQNLIVHARGVEFKFGDVISATLHFVIIAVLIYVVVKKLLRQEELLEKK